MSKIEFNNRVAIVTGAGGGLGRTHALALARRGVKVVVNDLGGAVDGTGGSATAAEKVVEEIKALGGDAIANGANVTNREQVADMVAQAIDSFGKVDILINNAGILRDKSFAKMELDDFQTVMDVHLMGSVNCTKAVWEHMRTQEYGRIVMTSSSSGLYGNFGQSNYGAAKMALVGLMNTLHLEGVRKGIHTNCLAPVAWTRMTSDLFPEGSDKLFKPEYVSEGLVYLCNDNAPSRLILAAGARGFAAAKIYETEGVSFADGEVTADNVAANIEAITNPDKQEEFDNGGLQGTKFAGRAMS